MKLQFKHHTQSQTPTHSSAKSAIKVGGSPLQKRRQSDVKAHPITDTHPFIRQVGDKSGWLSSSHTPPLDKLSTFEHI